MNLKKTVFTLDIDDYAPQLTRMTFPLMRYWARKIGAEFRVVKTRRWPGWPIPYEKLQLYYLSQEMKNDWNIFFDADALVHPELLDFTNFLPRDTVANNGSDVSAVRHVHDKYFLRDGRNIGTCGWCIVASDWTTDIWHPLEDMTMEEALARCVPTVGEASPVAVVVDAAGRPVLGEDGRPLTAAKPVIDREHLLDDFVMSRNVARYGLKYTTLGELWKKIGLPDCNVFWHKYTISVEQKAREMREVLESWNVPDYLMAGVEGWGDRFDDAGAHEKARRKGDERAARVN
jgi:hypothetical protein